MQDNQAVIRRLFEDAFNHDKSALFEELVSPDYVDATGERGPNALRQVIVRLRGAFADIHYTIDDVVAVDERVAVRWHWTGTHTGPFRGIAPTQKHVTNTGLGIFVVRDRRIVAATLETDRLGFLQAIGIVAPPDALFSPPR